MTRAETTVGRRTAGFAAARAVTVLGVTVLAVVALAAGALVGASPALAQDAQLFIDVASTADAAGADTREALTQSSGELRAGQARAVPLAVPAGRCVLVAARSAGSLGNVDVEVVRGRTVLSRDTQTGREAAARYCAGARPEHLQARVRAFRGAGAFALGVYVLPEGATAASAAAAPSSAGLLDRLAERVRASGAGMAPVTSGAREVLVAGNTAGELWSIDGQGNLAQRGTLGTVPKTDGNGHSYPTKNVGKAWELSGDIVFLANGGQPVKVA